MNNLKPSKTNTKDITQSELEDLYFTQGKSLDEIGLHYGFYDRQPIARLFKKFGIKPRSKSENSSKQAAPIPSREEVAAMIAGKSVLAASKEYGISRKMMTKYVEYYGLKPEYFVNTDHKTEILDSKFDQSSPKEIALALGITIAVVKYYRDSFPEVIYDTKTIKEKIVAYGYDMDNQGLTKQIQHDDASLYNSIMQITADHILQSNKLTERLYRIVNDFESDRVESCQHCDAKLKFYTFKLGYGNSDHQICMECNRSINGVSLVSQKLFWDIYNSLNDTEKAACKFSQLNNEKKVVVKEEDRLMLEDHAKLNKNCYFFDFVKDDKVIEFDGEYYHTDAEKETSKDAFADLKGYKILHIRELNYRKNPEVVLQQCINFLRQ